MKKFVFYSLTISIPFVFGISLFLLYLRFSYLLNPIEQNVTYELKLKITRHEGYYKFEPGIYFNKPKGSTFLINADGFRGTVSKGDLKGKHSIVAMGESSTMGIEVDNLYTWPSLLQRRLEAKGFDSAVLNAGIGGINSTQMLSLYRSEIHFLKPEIIIYYAGRNDQALGAEMPRFPGTPRWPDGFSNWMKQYLVFKKFEMRFWQYKILGREYVDFLPSVNRWQSLYEANLINLIREAKANKTCFIIVLQLMPYDKKISEMVVNRQFELAKRSFKSEIDAWPDLFRQLDVYQSQTRVAAATGVPVIELFSEQTGDMSVLFQPGDTIHLTKEGNDFLAAHMSRSLERLCPGTDHGHLVK